MDKPRLRLTAVLAGAALAVFAVTSSAQNTNTPTTGGSAAPTADQTAAPQTSSPSTSDQATPSTGTDATIGTSSRTTTTATDVTTTTPSTTFWLSPWGLVAIAVVAILILWAIFGRRGSTVVRDSYTSSSTRNAGPVNDRIVSPRAASGTETTTRTTDTDTRM